MAVVWSYSSLNLFKQCPKKYYHLRVAKDIKEPEGEALLYGKRVHSAAEEYVRDGTPIPPQFAFIQDALDELRKIPGERYCEYRLALNERFEPVDFFAPDVWWRGVADLLIIDEEAGEARIVDYKTGKSARYADTDQLEILALAVFKHFPKVKRIKGGLLFLVCNALVKAAYEDTAQQTMWGKWMQEITLLESCMESNTWNAKPNFTCQRYCPVKTCPHNGGD